MLQGTPLASPSIPHEPQATALFFVVVALLLAASALLSQATQRLRVPAGLIFLAIGMLAGSEGLGGIAFDDYRFAYRAGSAALALILFDGGLNTPVETLRRGPLALARFTETQQPGLYEVKVDRSARPLHFVVRGAQDESDLTVLPAEKWDWLHESLGAETVDTATRPIGASTVGSTGTRELWGWVLAAVLVLAVAEMALARRWARVESGDADGGFEALVPSAAGEIASP